MANLATTHVLYAAFAAHPNQPMTVYVPCVFGLAHALLKRNRNMSLQLPTPIVTNTNTTSPTKAAKPYGQVKNQRWTANVDFANARRVCRPDAMHLCMYKVAGHCLRPNKNDNHQPNRDLVLRMSMQLNLNKQ